MLGSIDIPNRNSLINSPYNSKIATKHPKEIAHQWWAEYLYEEILKREIL
jgi:hypothetical protein